jgi:hypothetical protein
MPPPIFYLVLVQIVIWLKTVLEGSPLAGTILFATFGAVVFMHLRGPARWIYDERTLRLGFLAIAMVGVIFACANLYQAVIDRSAITYIHGWFHGTTANPHQAGILMSLTLPGIMCLLFTTDKRQLLLRIFWLAMIVILCFGIYKTASRTSAVMAIIAVGIFFRHQQGNAIRLGLVLLGFFAVFSITIGTENLQNILDVGADDSVLSKWQMGQNTRQGVWNAQWSSFQQYFLFGAPLQSARMQFGESSWLGVASGLGLVGLMPMLFFGFNLVGITLRLNSIALVNKNNNYGIYASGVIAGIVALLVGSISEAFLLANLNFSLYATLQYILLSQFLLDCFPIVKNKSTYSEPFSQLKNYSLR